LRFASHPEASTNSASIAVVGAGLAGIACALRLRDAGFTACVFESQRAPGGRLATRRFALASFDHGAQYVTAMDAAFRVAVEDATAAGAAASWRPDWPARDASRELWVGFPAMNALPRWLARDLDVQYGTRITRLERGRHGWILLDDKGGAHAEFDAVALAIPAPAAAALAASRTALAARVKAVPMAPCWSVMVAFDAPVAGADDAGLPDDAMLHWYARNGSKPGREGPDAWVLHAAADWTRIELDQPAVNVQRALLDRFSEHIGRTLPRALLADAHRWRHARVEEPLGESCLLDAGAGIGFCGDWCTDARAEAAWLSGSALGRALLEARPWARSGKIRRSR
jgi:renalase